MNENNYCPCCGRHCDLKNPHCERGIEYARTGSVVKQEYGQNKSKRFCQDANYNAMDIDSKLTINLRSLGHVIRFLYEGKGSQKRILIILSEVGKITQRELTERLGIKPGSASEVIGKLEKAGLIERHPSSTDRRTVDICLTEYGKAKAEQASEQRKIRHCEMFSCLSQTEKDTLLSLAEKLNTDWNNRYKDFEHHKMRDKEHRPHKHHNQHENFYRHD